MTTRAELRELQREWYGKLAAEGFDDIEYGREDGMLKVANRENRGGIEPLEYSSTVAYFSQAGEFLEWAPWTNAIHRDAWRMHADGASLRDIAKAHGRSFKWAVCLVDRLRAAMNRWLAEHEGDVELPEPEPVEPRMYRRQRRPWRRFVGRQLALSFEESGVRK